MPVPADQNQFLFWAHRDHSKGNTHESWVLAEGPIQRGSLDIIFKITFPGREAQDVPARTTVVGHEEPTSPVR